ncbi:Xanthine/uracil/thiamine/ascorbate permease family protein [Minicystis rosea]|nr:Xanthine/uracil/thiamine/ascorbate permease family protein [Minicystis rosea]
MLTLPALLVPVALIACGSSTGTGTGGTGGGTGGTTPTTSSSSGTGGTATTSSSSGTGGTATTSSSSGTGGAPAGECINAADGAILQSQDVQKIATDCGTANITTPDNVKPCIIDGTKTDTAPGLSDPCATCFSTLVKCVINNCVPACLQPDSAACKTCRADKCDPAFYTCSGLPQQN